MSDSDDYDEWMFEDAGDYFYLEDAYAPADDLAEHTCPSPVGYDSAEDWDEHSRFSSYWADLKYNSDSYMSEKERDKAQRREQRQAKRKAQREAEGTPSKKCKYHLDSRSGSPLPFADVPPPIIWMSQGKRQSPLKHARDVKLDKVVSVLKDWRTTAHQDPAFGKRQARFELEAAKDAGYEGEDDTPIIPSIAKRRPSGQTANHKSSELAHTALRVQEIGNEEESNELPSELSALDPEALKRALREHLTAAGINVKSLDEDTLLALASQMFAAGDEADELVDGFAEDMLEDAEVGENGDVETKENGFSQWVTQKVSKRTRKDSKETSQEDDYGLSTPTSEPWPPPTIAKIPVGKVTGAKRKADEMQDGPVAGSDPKRKASYLAPTAASAAKASMKGRGRKG